MKISLPTGLIKKIRHILELVAKHRVIVLAVLTAVAIGYTSLKTQSLTSPSRSESTYETKQKELNNFQSIDYKFADQLKKDLSDIEIQVNQQLPSNRTNPFSE